MGLPYGEVKNTILGGGRLGAAMGQARNAGQTAAKDALRALREAGMTDADISNAMGVFGTRGTVRPSANLNQQKFLNNIIDNVEYPNYHDGPLLPNGTVSRRKLAATVVKKRNSRR